jgi:hypothetical protein
LRWWCALACWPVFSLLAYAEPELTPDTTPLERWWLAVESIGIEAAFGMHQYGIAARHCSSVAVQDSDVQQQCSDLAEIFVDKGTNLLDFTVGTNMGARAGWTKERVAALKQKADALMQALTIRMYASPFNWENFAQHTRRWIAQAKRLPNWRQASAGCISIA